MLQFGIWFLFGLLCGSGFTLLLGTLKYNTVKLGRVPEDEIASSVRYCLLYTSTPFRIKYKSNPDLNKICSSIEDLKLKQNIKVEFVKKGIIIDLM